MERTAKLKERRVDVLDRMKEINATALAEQDDILTDEQQKEYDKLQAEIPKLDARIAQLRAEMDAERNAPKGRTVVPEAPDVTVGGPRADKDPARGFERHFDFLKVVRQNAEASEREHVSDERLKALTVQNNDGSGVSFMLPLAYHPPGLRPAEFKAAVGSDEHSTSDFRYGGALIQTAFMPDLKSVGHDQDPSAGRTQMIPMSTLRVEIPARVDKNHSTSVSGGLTVARRAELEALSSSRMEMERVALTAHSLFGLSYASEEILQFSPISFSALLAQGFRDEFPAQIFHEKLFGLGGEEFVGVANADAAVSVSRTTSNLIQGPDIVGMRARCWGYSQAIWIANHDTTAQLTKLHIGLPSQATPTSIVDIYKPSMQEDRPDTLLGRPIFYSEFAETLGTLGDIMLINWSQYLEGVLLPLNSAESIHVRFTNHERAFKFWMMNAGACWWRSALTPKESSTTLSPIVLLAA